MESEPVDDLPAGKDWLFKPKWDGFWALAFRDGREIDIRSRNQKPLGRYFPELVEALSTLPAKRFVLVADHAPADGRCGAMFAMSRLPTADR